MNYSYQKTIILKPSDVYTHIGEDIKSMISQLLEGGLHILEFRALRAGDRYINIFGQVVTAAADERDTEPRFIVDREAPPAQPPSEFLREGFRRMYPHLDVDTYFQAFVLDYIPTDFRVPLPGELVLPLPTQGSVPERADFSQPLAAHMFRIILIPRSVSQRLKEVWE